MQNQAVSTPYLGVVSDLASASETKEAGGVQDYGKAAGQHGWLSTGIEDG